MLIIENRNLKRHLVTMSSPIKQTLGKTLQKINQSVNLMYMIEMLERKDEVARCLKISNAEEDEEERSRICREAADACLKEIHEHCVAYLNAHKDNGSYEEWIREFHPDNATMETIDHRFYVEESDHRIIWNSYCDMQGHSDWKIKPTDTS
jgi:hypothetical protein